MSGRCGPQETGLPFLFPLQSFGDELADDLAKVQVLLPLVIEVDGLTLPFLESAPSGHVVGIEIAMSSQVQRYRGAGILISFEKRRSLLASVEVSWLPRSPEPQCSWS